MKGEAFPGLFVLQQMMSYECSSVTDFAFAGIGEATKVWVIDHIRHYMECAGCANSGHDFNYAEIVSRRRRAHKLAIEEEEDAPLQGSEGAKNGVLESEVKNDEIWREGPYGRRWLAGNFGKPDGYFRMSYTEDYEDGNKENNCTG